MSVLLENNNTLVVEGSLREEAIKFADSQLDRVISKVTVVNDDGTQVQLSPALSNFLRNVLAGVGRGPMTVTGLPDEVTTTVAAGLLGVSRPTLMKWIHAGEINSFAVGSHTRLHTADVLAARGRLAHRRVEAFEALRAFDEEFSTDDD